VSNNLFLARRFPASRAQAGVALVVGLILLVVLTVLALSTLRTATLGLLMAGNDQYRENAFQLAESGITARLRQATLDATQLDAAADCPADADPPLAMDAASAGNTPRRCAGAATAVRWCPAVPWARWAISTSRLQRLAPPTSVVPMPGWSRAFTRWCRLGPEAHPSAGERSP
jgi:Tfp pilus assembly protein PilX